MALLEVNKLQLLEKELEKVNSIIKEIAAENENITPILPSDYTLFEDFFNKEEQHTYGNSWLYITQGTFGIGSEKLGYKYYDGENLCALALYPKIEQPNIIMLHWIRPLGKNILPIIAKLAEQIREKYNIFSYIKKLFPEQYEYLSQHGFTSAEEFPWHSSAHSEDDTYPEIVYDRELTLEAFNKASRSSSLGRVKRGISNMKREIKLEITNLNSKEDAWHVVTEYFFERSKSPNKVIVSTPFDYYNMIFYDHESTINKKILLINKEPAGLYIIEENKKFDTVSMYCCFALRKYHRYLTDFLKLTMFKEKKSKYINCGGSEDEGINYFKEKYEPIAKKTMYLATNYFL